MKLQNNIEQLNISIIVAKSKNNVIGIDNKLPWKLYDDMKNFKQLTNNKIIIMGRKTYESIGKPLPNRFNIVISSRYNYKYDNLITVESIEESLTKALEIFLHYDKLNKDKYINEILVIGGYNIYKSFIKYANNLYITLVDVNINDINESQNNITYFPNINLNNWKLLYSKEYSKNDKNQYNFTINTYIKINHNE